MNTINTYNYEYCVLTPTYIEHFSYIKDYVKSVQKYVKKNVDYVFVVERDNVKELTQILAPYCEKINFNILTFEELLINENIWCNPSELLKVYGKYAYQTLKKYCAMLTLPHQYFLVLDSESMWIRQTDMERLFEDFFSDPFIAGSRITPDKLGIIKKNVCQCTDYLLDFKSDKWFLESFNWFYEKTILLDLINELGTPIDLIKKAQVAGKLQGFEPYVFEICLYQNYIYKNRQKYHYRILDVNQKCKDYLGQAGYKRYLNAYYSKFNGEGGVLEFVCNMLCSDNVEALATLIKDNHFLIIRFENVACSPRIQKKFIKIADPYILAASQNHPWGINEQWSLKIKFQYYLWFKEGTKQILKKLHLYESLRMLMTGKR